MVRPRLRGAHEAVECGRELSDVRRAMLRRGEEIHGRLHLAQRLLHHADVGLARQASDHQVDVLAGGHFGIAHHVPRGTPHECARHGVDEVAQMRHGGLP